MSVNQNEKKAAETVSQWVTFRLEDEIYGIDVLKVQEVLRITEISPVPGAPEYVLGIINLRGNVVTVIDARNRFNLPPKESDDSSRIIVVDAFEKIVGLLVDNVSEVAYVPDSQIELAPNVGADDSNKFISGVYNREGQLLIMVDLAKLINSE